MVLFSVTWCQENYVSEFRRKSNCRNFNTVFNFSRTIQITKPKVGHKSISVFHIHDIIFLNFNKNRRSSAYETYPHCIHQCHNLLYWKIHIVRSNKPKWIGIIKYHMYKWFQLWWNLVGNHIITVTDKTCDTDLKIYYYFERREINGVNTLLN